MGGRGKSKKVAPAAGAAQVNAPGVLQTFNRQAKSSKLASLPKQYEFTPANASATVFTQTRLPQAEPQPGPTVKDYPPPTRLFQSPDNLRGVTPAAAGTHPSSSGNRLPQPQPQQSPPEIQQPPLQRRKTFSQPRLSHSPESTSLPRSDPPQQQNSRQSPHSSQAQNEIDDDEETPGDVAEGYNPPTEPTLSEDALAAVNSLLILENRDKYCEVLSPLMEPDTTWFGRDQSSLTRKISKIMKNKFDGPYYSWSCVPQARRERWFLEFAKEHTWKPEYTGQVQAKFDEIGLNRLKDMVSKARNRGERPSWIIPTLWTFMNEEWATEEAKARHETASAARMSDRGGLGPHTHVAGPKSFYQIEQEMIAELGRPVTLAEVFLRTHTKADGTFVDGKAQKVAQEYKAKKAAKMAELQTDASSGNPAGNPDLALDEDNEIFLQSTYVNGRGNIYGVGSLESTVVNRKRKSSESSSSFLSMQKQLEDAHRKLEEQAALNAQQQRKIEMLSLAHEYFSAKDPEFAAFIASRASPASSPPIGNEPSQ